MDKKMREFIDDLCKQLAEVNRHYGTVEVDSDAWNDVWMDNMNDLEQIVRDEVRARGIKLQ